LRSDRGRIVRVLLMAVMEKPKRVPRGAKTMLSRELGKRICDSIAAGNGRLASCQAEGVDPNTFGEWIRRGEERDERPPTELTRWFAAEVRKAEAKAVKVAAQVIVQDQSWQSKAWWLERRHPEDWARPADRLELTGAGGGPVQISLAFDPTPLAARQVAARVVDVDAEEIT
jgi:hypothetical protein